MADPAEAIEVAQKADEKARRKKQEGTTQVDQETKKSEGGAMQTASEDGEEQGSNRGVAMDSTLVSGTRPHNVGEKAVTAQRLHWLESDWKVVTGSKIQL